MTFETHPPWNFGSNTLPPSGKSTFLKTLQEITIKGGGRDRGLNLPPYEPIFPSSLHYLANFSILPTFLHHFSLHPILFLPPLRGINDPFGSGPRLKSKNITPHYNAIWGYMPWDPFQVITFKLNYQMHAIQWHSNFPFICEKVITTQGQH